MTPCPVCDSASVVDEEGCCIHCGAPRRLPDRELARMGDEDARYDAAVEEQTRAEEQEDGE